jgi:hypothetical protein
LRACALRSRCPDPDNKDNKDKKEEEKKKSLLAPGKIQPLVLSEDDHLWTEYRYVVVCALLFQ